MAQYSSGDADISVTSLIDSPRKAALERLYADTIEGDVAGNIFSLLGSSIHTILERSGVGLQEERLYADINGWRVSGQFDYMDSDGVIWDWKLASVWEITNGVKIARERQLNCYAHLSAVNGVQVTGLRVGFILRDWSEMSAKTEANYPPFQVMVFPIPLWSESERQTYMEERVRIHQESRITLPECSEEDRWAKQPKYAVMKTGNARASKLHDTQFDALADAAKRGTMYYVENRPGVSTRCVAYCSVADRCDQWQQLKKT